MPGDGVHFEVLFDHDDVFGPVKCLQLIAALNLIPDWFSLERGQAPGQQRVEVRFGAAADRGRIVRIFGKISTLSSAGEWRSLSGCAAEVLSRNARGEDCRPNEASAAIPEQVETISDPEGNLTGCRDRSL